MNISERVTYLRNYRAKLHKELDQMHYGKVSERQAPAHAQAHDSAERLWAIAIAMLLIAVASVSQIV